ncbi:MAG: hypothetical protein ABIG95_03160 [Candidatus Woesearchaeota archaeon]
MVILVGWRDLDRHPNLMTLAVPIVRFPTQVVASAVGEYFTTTIMSEPVVDKQDYVKLLYGSWAIRLSAIADSTGLETPITLPDGLESAQIIPLAKQQMTWEWYSKLVRQHFYVWDSAKNPVRWLIGQQPYNARILGYASIKDGVTINTHVYALELGCQFGIPLQVNYVGAQASEDYFQVRTEEYIDIPFFSRCPWPVNLEESLAQERIAAMLPRDLPLRIESALMQRVISSD